jgi:Uma2 family endonuclease
LRLYLLTIAHDSPRNQPRRYTATEYLVLEIKSEARHDFISGHIIERPGDTTTHNTIVGNCLMAFRLALQHSENYVYVLGVLLVLRENEYYTYPNMMVCGEDEGAGEIALIRRSQLLLDVSNPETDDYDRGRKFKLYRELPSLRHHIIVSQAARAVEYLRRNEANQWIITILTELEEMLVIPELNLTLTLGEIYDGTDVMSTQHIYCTNKERVLK